MSKAQNVIRVIDQINLSLGKAVSFLLLPLAFITFYEVAARYIFSRPTIWSWDLNIQLFAILSLLGGGYALLQKSHVAVDLFVAPLSPKKRAWIDLLTSAFFFFGIGVLMVLSWDVAWASWVAREKMPTIWAPPYYPFKMAVPIGAFFLFLQGISTFLRNLIIVTSKEGGKA